MIPMVLGDGNGRGQSPVQVHARSNGRRNFVATGTHGFLPGPDVSNEKAPYLFFRGRIKTNRVRGWLPNALRLELNGQAIAGKRISNRPQAATTMRGDTDIYITGAENN